MRTIGSAAVLPLAIAGAFVLCSPAAAITVDLTGGIGASGFINGAEFVVEGDLTGSGSGNFDAFLRNQQPTGNTTVERGYNTSGALHFDQKGGVHTHDITLAEIPIVNRLNESKISVDFRQFILDADEKQNGTDDFLSIDALQIYVSSTGSLSPSTFSPAGDELGGTLALGTLVYNMDGAPDGNSQTLLWIDPGNGSTDMSLYVPDALFDGYADSDFVYLYAYHGNVGESPPSGAPAGDYGVGASFEEWGVLVGVATFSIEEPIPEPVTAGGLMLGVGMLAGYFRRRRR